MSKNKNHQGKRANVMVVDEAIPEEIKDKIVEAVIEEIEEMTEVIEPTIGEVVNCDKLYVRKGPSKEAEPLRIIDKGYKVEIDKLEAVPNGWLKVDGGYCMEKYIKVIN